jgi:hypothetical protein
MIQGGQYGPDHLVRSYGGLTRYMHVRALRSLVHFAPPLPHHQARWPGCVCAMSVMTTGQYNYTTFE